MPKFEEVGTPTAELEETTETPTEGNDSDWDDDVSEETADDTEEVTEAVTEPTETEEVAKPTSLDDIQITYNGETLPLSNYEPDVIVANFQKGMNYDKMMASYEDKLSNLPERIFLQELADQEGKDTLTFIADTKQAIEDSKIEAMIARGVTSEEATAVIEAEKIKYQQAKEQRAAEKQASEQQAKEQQRNDEVTKFFTDHKDLATAPVEELPQEIIDAYSKGESLEKAYSSFMENKLKAELAETKQKLKIQEQTETAKARSVGSVKSLGTTQSDILDELWGN